MGTDEFPSKDRANGAARRRESLRQRPALWATLLVGLLALLGAVIAPQIPPPSSAAAAGFGGLARLDGRHVEGGGGGVDWTNAANWDNGAPSSSTNVCIPAGESASITDQIGRAKDVSIASGAGLKIINGSYNNNPVLSASGTITNAGTIVLTKKDCGDCFAVLSADDGTINTGFGSEDSGAGHTGANAVDSETFRHRLWNATMNGQHPTYANTGTAAGAIAAKFLEAPGTRAMTAMLLASQ